MPSRLRRSVAAPKSTNPVIKATAGQQMFGGVGAPQPGYIVQPRAGSQGLDGVERRLAGRGDGH